MIVTSEVFTQKENPTPGLNYFFTQKNIPHLSMRLVHSRVFSPFIWRASQMPEQATNPHSFKQHNKIIQK